MRERERESTHLIYTYYIYIYIYIDKSEREREKEIISSNGLGNQAEGASIRAPIKNHLSQKITIQWPWQTG